jgi:hypothetical protein
MGSDELEELAGDIFSYAGIKTITFLELLVPLLIFGFEGGIERLG